MSDATPDATADALPLETVLVTAAGALAELDRVAEARRTSPAWAAKCAKADAEGAEARARDLALAYARDLLFGLATAEAAAATLTARTAVRGACA